MSSEGITEQLDAVTIPQAVAAPLPADALGPDALGPDAPEKLPRPESTLPSRVVWHYAIPITLMHVLALGAFVPQLFSWTGVVAALLGLYVFGSLGINLCYHRLLSHRSFKCPTWLERVFVILALCCLEDAPGRWVATHRMHHKDSDKPSDPHSPLVNFFWGHMGWLIFQNRDLHRVSSYERFARDVLRQPFYLKLERRLLPMWIYLIHAALFYAAGFAIGYFTTGTTAEAVRMGLSLLVWGVFVRTVLVWHITWSVNSLTHLLGYRSHDTGEGSRNNWFVALVSNGEGWHNNHHAFPASATNWHRWWEFDVVYLTIAALEKVGLAWDVNRPKKINASSAK